MKSKVLFLSLILISTVTIAILYYGASSPGKNNLQSDGLPNQNQGFVDFSASWSTGAPLPVATCNGGGASYTRNDTGWLYTLGGWISTGVIPNVRRYNVNTNSWSNMAFLPITSGLEYFATAVLNDYIYVIGGYNGTNGVNTFIKYDINSDTWLNTGTNFPIAAEDCKAVGYQDSLIYVAGGWSSNAPINNVYVYNIHSNSFRAATHLPAPRHNGAFSRTGDTLIYIGGFDATNTPTATTYKGLINQFNKSAITWTTGMDFPGGPREGWDAANWGSYGIISVGGWNGTGYTNTCYRYSPGTNTWISLPIKTTSEYTAFVGSVYVGNSTWKLVTAGGYNGSILTVNEILTDQMTTLHDVSTQSIDIAPVVLPGNYIPKATFYNNGHVGETFYVSIVIGTYTSTKTVSNLASGASQQISFDSWNATAGGHNVKVWTHLTGDMNNSNDTLNKGIFATTQFWTYGVHNIYKISDATAVSYTRNDTGWVFSIGGYDILSNPINKLTIYNVNSNSWTEKNPIPGPRSEAASAILKDSIYVIGGTNDGTNLVNTLYKYSINSNIWTTKTNYPISLSGCKAIGYQDSLIYVAGGWNGSVELNNVYLYDVNTNSWRPATSLPLARSSGAFSRIGDTLVYVGGYFSSSIYATTFKGVISQTDRSIITWTQGADYPGGVIQEFDASPWGNLGIIMVGGMQNGGGPRKNCYVYSPGANTWTPRPDKQIAEMSASVASVYLGNNNWKFIATSGYTSDCIDTTEIWTETIPTVGIKNISSQIPDKFILNQNYPNPFNPTTKIRFDIPDRFPIKTFGNDRVVLKVYDILGKEIRTLVNESLQSGTYEVTFDGSNFPSGIYFYRINTGSFSESKKMLMIK